MFGRLESFIHSEGRDLSHLKSNRIQISIYRVQSLWGTLSLLHSIHVQKTRDTLSPIHDLHLTVHVNPRNRAKKKKEEKKRKRQFLFRDASQPGRTTPEKCANKKKKKNTLMETKKRGDGIRKRNPKMKRTKKVKV